MALAPVRYKLAPVPYYEAVIGSGAYGHVYKATEDGTSKQVAIKKSRVSKRVKRPILRHESRVLQLLQGHPTIPTIYGYGHLEHFEYIAMEFLGPSIAEQQKEGAGLGVETVIRITYQVLGALQHIHSLGIVHRDVKPQNLLCSLEDDSVVKIIDFGLSKPFSCGQPTKYDPPKERRNIMGSLSWASLNSHNGIDLSSRDDLESLAYTALFLLRGNLPWKSRPRTEAREISQEIVRHMKLECSGPALCTGFSDEFGEMLTYSRSLEFNQLPDYARLKGLFAELAKNFDCSLNRSLDWTPYYPETTNPISREPEIGILFPNEAEYENRSDSSDDDSYGEMDIDEWNRQGERDENLTFPASQTAELDAPIPPIIEVRDADRVD